MGNVPVMATGECPTDDTNGRDSVRLSSICDLFGRLLLNKHSIQDLSMLLIRSQN